MEFYQLLLRNKHKDCSEVAQLAQHHKLQENYLLLFHNYLEKSSKVIL